MKKVFNYNGFFLITLTSIGFLVLVASLLVCIFLPECHFVRSFWGGSKSGIVRSTVLLILYSITCGILVPACFILSVKKTKAKSVFLNAPTLTSPAKVVSKITQTTGGRFSVSYCLVAFEFPDGTRKSFGVDTIIFSSLVENDNGILTYKEQDGQLIFLSFQRNI